MWKDMRYIDYKQIKYLKQKQKIKIKTDNELRKLDHWALKAINVIFNGENEG